MIANLSSPPLCLHFQFHPEIFKYFLALISCFCGKGGLRQVLFGILTTPAANNHTLFSVHSPYSLIDFLFFPFSCFLQLLFLFSSSFIFAQESLSIKMPLASVAGTREYHTTSLCSVCSRVTQKKDTRVLTTDMVLRYKYSGLSRLMSLKGIISAYQ